MSELWHATSRRVLGLTLRVLGDRAAAEEALLDTFVQVWRQAARFDTERGSAITWLLLLARTRAIDARRGRARQTAREAPVAPNAVLRQVEHRHDPASPAEALSLDERAARVRRAMRELPEPQRVLVEASFFAGMSHGDIAAAPKLPLGTVKTRIRSGLSALRHTLAGIREDDDVR